MFKSLRGHAVDPHQGLRDIGLDSLMAIELRNRLQDAVGEALPATLAFDFPTPSALVGYLSDRLIAPDAAVPTVDPAVPDETTQVAALSDDEAEDLLRQELDAMTGRSGRRKGAGR